MEVPAPVTALPVTSQVTLLDIYTRQVEMQGSIGIVHEQLRALPDHEQRLRRLEDMRSRIYGAAFAIAIASSVVGTYLTHVIVYR